jgi:hypothetical protein
LRGRKPTIGGAIARRSAGPFALRITVMRQVWPDGDGAELAVG